MWSGAALGGYITAAFLIGGLINHLIHNWQRRHRLTKQQLDQVTETQQHLYWAVAGKPKDDLSPAVPGLLADVQTLTVTVQQLAQDVASNRTAIVTTEARIERHEAYHERKETASWNGEERRKPSGA